MVSTSGFVRERPTAPRRVLAAEREQRAVELRKAGYTFRQIGEALGISHVAASKAVRRALKRLNEQTEGETNELRALELERLNALNAAFWAKAMSGDVQAGRLVLRVIEQRARLLDLVPSQAVTIDQRQVAFEGRESFVPRPMEPEKLELAKALSRIPQKAREYLISASDRGQAPGDALKDLIAMGPGSEPG